jgi:hypothetical protein
MEGSSRTSTVSGSLDELESHEERMRTFMNHYCSLNKQVVSSMEIAIRRIEDQLREREEREQDYERKGSDHP